MVAIANGAAQGGVGVVVDAAAGVRSAPPAIVAAPFEGACGGGRLIEAETLNQYIGPNAAAAVDAATQQSVKGFVSSFRERHSKPGVESRGFPKKIRVNSGRGCGCVCRRATSPGLLRMHDELLSWFAAFGATLGPAAKVASLDVTLAFEARSIAGRPLGVFWALLPTLARRAGALEARQNFVKFDVVHGGGVSVGDARGVVLRLARRPFTRPLVANAPCELGRPAKLRAPFKQIHENNVGALHHLTEQELVRDLLARFPAMHTVVVQRVRGRWQLLRDLDTFVVVALDQSPPVRFSAEEVAFALRPSLSRESLVEEAHLPSTV